jgi:integrase
LDEQKSWPRLSESCIITGFPVKCPNLARLATLGPRHIANISAAIDKVSTKRHWLKTIRALFEHGVPAMLEENPAAFIPLPKTLDTKGLHSWTDAEIAQYRAYWPYGTQQRLVFEFTLETVSRRGEVVQIGPQHLYEEDGQPWIRIARTHGSKDVDIPATSQLMAAIDAMPKKHLTFIVTADGKPRSKAGLGTDFAKWLARPDSWIVAGCTA